MSSPVGVLPANTDPPTATTHLDGLKERLCVTPRGRERQQRRQATGLVRMETNGVGDTHGETRPGASGASATSHKSMFAPMGEVSRQQKVAT